MSALICGSLAYDTIMVFPERFRDHILPEKMHILNVSFLVPHMRREFGGVAGMANIVTAFGGTTLAFGGLTGYVLITRKDFSFLGGALAWMSIQKNHGFGTLTIGQWTAWPLAGSVNADPYSKAKVAAAGDVPLGAAEGLAFHARLDRRGNTLKRNCQYQLTGLTPPARL